MKNVCSGKIVYLITSSMSALLLRGQLDHLAGEGFDVVVGTGLNNGPGPAFDKSARVVDLGFQRTISPVADIRSLVRTIRLLRRERPEFVNYSTPKAALIGAIAARLLQIPVRIYVVRGLRYETQTGWGRRLLMLLERWIMRSSTMAIMNSPSLLSTAVAEGLVSPDRCAVLAGGSGNGIDTRSLPNIAIDGHEARVRLGLDEEAMVIGFVGRLTRDKGVVDLCEAFFAVAAERSDVVLLLVGIFEENNAVPEDVQKRLLESDSVVHVVWMEDPSAAYAAMDVLAFPSYREGLPNVVLEAQLAGVPVVGYAATGTVDAVDGDETARLVAVADVRALARELEWVLGHDDERQQMASAAPRFVIKNFERSLIWAELTSLYRDHGVRIP